MGGRDRSPSTVVAAGLLLAGTALVVVGAFLPWVVSGASERNSFATVRSAERLALVEETFGLVVLRAWYLVPLLASMVPVLITLHKVRAAAVAAMALALLTAAVALIVLSGAPERGVGPVVSATAGVVVCIAAVALLVLDARDRRPRSRSDK